MQLTKQTTMAAVAVALVLIQKVSFLTNIAGWWHYQPYWFVLNAVEVAVLIYAVLEMRRTCIIITGFRRACVYLTTLVTVIIAVLLFGIVVENFIFGLPLAFWIFNSALFTLGLIISAIYLVKIEDANVSNAS